MTEGEAGSSNTHSPAHPAPKAAWPYGYVRMQSTIFLAHKCLPAHQSDSTLPFCLYRSVIDRAWICHTSLCPNNWSCWWVLWFFVSHLSPLVMSSVMAKAWLDKYSLFLGYFLLMPLKPPLPAFRVLLCSSWGAPGSMGTLCTARGTLPAGRLCIAEELCGNQMFVKHA